MITSQLYSHFAHNIGYCYPVLQTETAESWVLYATWGFAFNICNCLSVCLSVLPSVWQFLLVFSDFLHNDRLLEYSKTNRAFFSRKISFCQIFGKRTQNGPKISFFWMFWKILSLVFLGNNWKWKQILLLINLLFHNNLYCYFTKSLMSGKILVPELKVKILSVNQIAGFFKV